MYKVKGYQPEICYEYRKEILESIQYVDSVIPSPWLIDDDYLKSHDIDVLVHGSDNANCISQSELVILPRTEGISSTSIRNKAVGAWALKKNITKKMFTPGPATNLACNYDELEAYFGRGDSTYDALFQKVEEWILSMTGHNKLIALQGSATLALEIACNNFLHGNIAVLNTGYYGKRLAELIPFSLRDRVSILASNSSCLPANRLIGSLLLY